ncbi:MAG: excinuclease ABC subunit UvrC [Proteobacteria bacterium]|nr:excinuclease ABC subunit UvrC [Pseudomonadota bacterium]
MNKGLDKLKDYVKYLPSSAGVYKMINSKNEVLYVGKAKNLQNRVRSYTQLSGLTSRIKLMVSQIDSVEITETASEAEALILESSLIKDIQPKYNVKLKDDSSYAYIAIPNDNSTIPRIYRGDPSKVKDMLFGPYPNKRAAQKTLDLVIKIFKLRTCTNADFKSRKKPCIRYDINLCSAPCVGYLTIVEYEKNLKDARSFLKGDGIKLVKRFEQKMTSFAAEQKYEQATVFRDRIRDLNATLQTTANAYYKEMQNSDIWGLSLESGRACVQLFIYRNGLHMGNKKIFPESIEEKSVSEIMHYVLALHYRGSQPPPSIFVNNLPDDADLLQEVFSKQIGKKVYINVPARGDKAKVVQQATLNASNELKRKLVHHSAIKKQFKELARILDFNDIIKRIEVFDVSNTQGTNSVASMVVATDEGMQPSQYRKFKVKTKDTPDDYAMMREILTRRYKRVMKENIPMPEIVMVDGGKGHLGVLVDVFDSLGLDKTSTKLCGIAKGEFRDKGLEKIFLQGRTEPLPIDYNSELIFLLQNIRDESHRTAIGYHRQLRAKAMFKSPLDSVEGIGGAKKKALINHFGGISGLKNATIQEIAKVNGISLKLAEDVFYALR